MFFLLKIFLERANWIPYIKLIYFKLPFQVQIWTDKKHALVQKYKIYVKQKIEYKFNFTVRNYLETGQKLVKISTRCMQVQSKGDWSLNMKRYFQKAPCKTIKESNSSPSQGFWWNLKIWSIYMFNEKSPSQKV